MGGYLLFAWKYGLSSQLCNCDVVYEHNVKTTWRENLARLSQADNKTGLIKKRIAPVFAAAQ